MDTRCLLCIRDCLSLHIDISALLNCFEDCRPDGAKKAYVRLTTDYDALDVANKIGII